MRLLLHQSVTDLRHLRPLLLAWLATLAARTFLLAYPLDGLIADPFEVIRRWPLEFPHLAVWVASVGLAVVIGVRLVQSDSPSRSTAFWLTRPIAGRTMVVAKFATAVCILVLPPIAVDVAVLAANGLPADVLYTAAWQGLLEHLVLVGPVLALAAVSADAGGFALAGLAVFAGGLASLVVVGTFVGRGTPPGPDEQWSPLAEIVIVAASGVVVTSVQYLGRSRRVSAALAGAAVLLWGIAFFSGPTPLAAETRLDAAQPVRLRAIPGSTAVVDGIHVRVLRSHCSGGACEVAVRESRAALFGRSRPWGEAAPSLAYYLVNPATEVRLRTSGSLAVPVISPLVPGSHLFATWRRLRFRPVAAWADSRTLADSWLVPVLRERVGPAAPEMGSVPGGER